MKERYTVNYVRYLYRFVLSMKPLAMFDKQSLFTSSILDIVPQRTVWQIYVYGGRFNFLHIAYCCSVKNIHIVRDQLIFRDSTFECKIIRSFIVTEKNQGGN